MTFPDPTVRPEVLQTAALARFPHRSFDDQFTVHRYWEIADKEGFLAERGPSIRGMIAAGPLKIDRALLDRLPGLQIIANIGVGYDRIKIAAAAERGIIVTNTPDVLTEEVADLTMGLLISTIRRIPQANRFLLDGKWLAGGFPNSPTLRGRTVGILGLGRIGKAIARRLSGFEVTVVYTGRNRQEDVPLRYYPSLLDMARDADVIIATLPGTDETQGLIDAAVLEALGPQGVLVNVARGSVVQQSALIKALQDGTIEAAGLDVFVGEPNIPPELMEMENVVLTPHIGSASMRTRMDMIELLHDNLVSWFAGEGPRTPVAETPWPRRELSAPCTEGHA